MDTTTLDVTTDVAPTDLPTVTEAPVSDAIESNPVGSDEHGKGEGHTPVTLCHNGHTITVDDDAVPGHLTHHGDDYLGECIVIVPEPEPEPTPEPPVVPVVTPPVTQVPVPPVVEAPVVTPPKVEAPVVTVPKAEVPPVTEVSNPVGPSMTPCLSEDGSVGAQEFPCLWDAQHTGNGLGTSFVLDGPADTAHYVTDVLADGTILTAADVVPVQAEVSVVPVSNPVGLADTGTHGVSVLSGIALALVIIGVAAIRLTRGGKRRAHKA